MLHGNADEPSSVINARTDNSDSRFATVHIQKIIAEPETIERRNRKACDSLLIRLCHHHPAYASAALKEIAPKAKDDDDLPLTKIIVSKITVTAPERKPEIIPLPLPAPEPIEELRPTINVIINEVAGFYELTPTDLQFNGRQAFVMRARHVAMYLCREMTLNSLPKIGRQFGDRDHTTVLYAWCKISALVGTARGAYIETHSKKRFTDLYQFNARLKDEVDVLQLRLRQALLNNPEAPCNSPQTAAI